MAKEAAQHSLAAGGKTVTVIWSCTCWDGNQIWTVPIDKIIWRDQVDDQGFLPIQVPCPVCFLRGALGQISPGVLGTHANDLEDLRNDQIEIENEAAGSGIK